MQRNLNLERYALITVLLALFLMILLPFLQGLLLGLLVALVCFPLNDVMRKRLKLPGWISALVSTFILSVFVVLPLFFIGFTLVKDAVALFSQPNTWNQHLNFDNIGSNPLLNELRERLPFLNDPGLQEKLMEVASQVAQFLAKFLGGLLSVLPNYAFEVVMFVLAFYYGLVDGIRIKSFISSILPFEKQDLKVLMSTTEMIVKGVLVGSLMAGVVQGVVICIGFLTLDVPRPFFFFVVTVILSFLPMVGSLPTGVGAAIYLAIQGRWGAAFIMLGFFALAAMSDNIVKPWALNGQASLHPLLGLASALGGLAVFGFLGLFLGPLLTALFISMLEIMQRPDDSAPTSI